MRLGKLLVTAALVTATAGGALVADRGIAHAGPQPPHVTLLSATDDVTLHRFDTFGKFVQLDLGFYVSSPDARLEIDAIRTRPGDPYSLFQVTRNGSTVTRRPLGIQLPNLFFGLQGFGRLDVVDAAGHSVFTEPLDFCPNGFGPERVNDRGPLAPTFPFSCFASLWTRGFMFGIDRGYGVSLLDNTVGGEPYLELRDGRYRATVTIDERWARALSATPARHTVSFTVVTDPCTDPNFCSPGAAPQRRTPAAWQPPQRHHSGDSRSLVPPYAPPARDSLPVGTDDLPDLVPMPSAGIFVHNEPTDGHDYLTFGATVANLGGMPLDVEGFRRRGTGVMDAYQYFVRDGQIVGKARVGEMMYDPRVGHQHWHFLDFAAYYLTDATHRRIQQSGKEAFCIAPTDAIDLTLPHADVVPFSIGLQGACGRPSSVWTRETMPAGWGDTYTQDRPGQAFDITTVPNGTYAIQIVANPLGRLHESSSTNNVSFRTIVLGGVPGARTVEVPPYEGLDTEGGGR